MKKQIINFLSNLFPTAFTNFAYKQLTNPQIRKLRANEIAILDQSKKEDFLFKGFNIKTYVWEGGEKEVLLIHGWEGQAGNFSDLIEPLLQNGFTVRAFDGPSHGFSSSGKTSLLEFSELVGVLIRKYGVKNLISHSFGGVATTYALYNNLDLEINKYILLTTPDRFLERIDDVVKQVGISEKVKKSLIVRLEKENNFKVETLNVSDFVKKIKVNESLIIHDKNDKVIPIGQSRNVHKNWKESIFQEIEGTGHFRILRTKSVSNKVLTFLG